MKKFIVFTILVLGFSGCVNNYAKIQGEIEEKLTAYIGEEAMQGIEIKNVEKETLYKATMTSNEEESVLYFDKEITKFVPVMVEIDLENKPADGDVPASGGDGDEEAPPVATQAVPHVELFVMSHCPYGTQIEKGLLPVLETLGDKISFELKFVDYAMHGKKEIDEQLKQYCIQKDNPDVFLSYLECFLEAGDGASCVASTGIDAGALENCVTTTDEEFGVIAGFEDQSTWKGNYPTFNVHKPEVDMYGVGGSPSFVLNGQEISTARDSLSLLNTICKGFAEAPEECSTELSSESPSPGFGFGAGGAGGDASCGE